MSAGLAHLFGDYVVQSDWMANEKTKHHGPALAHAASYAACFLPLTRNPRALAVIGGTHFIIDHWRLARHIIWVKNQAAPKAHRYPWSHGSATGYHGHQHERPITITTPGGQIHGRVDFDEASDCIVSAKPDWMAVWLMIVADNTLHLAINRWALKRWP